MKLPVSQFGKGRSLLPVGGKKDQLGELNQHFNFGIYLKLNK